MLHVNMKGNQIYEYIKRMLILIAGCILHLTYNEIINNVKIFLGYFLNHII